MQVDQVDKEALAEKLRALGARDMGRKHLLQSIYYDRAGEWMKDGKTFVRLRNESGQLTLTYKREREDSLTGVEEIELGITDWTAAQNFLEAVGLRLVTQTEKYRHSFRFGSVVCDIDEWPQIPPWLEIEGQSEAAVKEMAKKLGLDWGEAVFGTASSAIEKHYGIVLRNLHSFTFEKIE